MTDSNQGPEMTDQPTLHDRLLTAMESVGRLEKEGSVGNKYKYITEEQVKVACQKACISAAVMPSGIAIEVISDESVNIYSKAHNMVKVRAAICFGHGDEVRRFEGIGSSADQGDKAYMQAQTGALREAWKNVFIIPSGSDPEQTDHVEPPPEKKAKPSARREATPTEQAMGEGPMTGDQRGILKGHGERLGMSQVAKAATCQEVTGKNPSQLTVNDANKLIEHMAGLS